MGLFGSGFNDYSISIYRGSFNTETLVGTLTVHMQEQESNPQLTPVGVLQSNIFKFFYKGILPFEIKQKDIIRVNNIKPNYKISDVKEHKQFRLKYAIIIAEKNV